MHLHKVDIKNFRLLEKVSLFIEERTTVIVGRNNTGKTSLTELFRRLLSDRPTFRLEDFPLSVYEQFWEAFERKRQGCEESAIREALPFIEIKLTISYDKHASNLGLLGDFIIDLNPDCTEVLIVIRYQLKDGQIGAFFGDSIPVPADPQKAEFFRAIKERIPECYSARVLTVDSNDPTNEKAMEWPKLQTLIGSGFINAQRGLDDVTHRDRDVLGRVLEALFINAKSDLADPRDRDVAQKLEEAVKSIQEDIDGDFKDQLGNLLPAFSLFGYPGLGDPGLCAETVLDVQRLLTNHTKIYYTGVSGINLPEAYNGLGARNLIFMLLKLLEFFKSFMANQAAPGVQLVFIEEPEVHLHPQMQEVFISKLSDIADVFAKTFNNGLPWPVQFIVTTHSSHVANRAPFESMRYFLSTPDEHVCSVCTTQIKDLRKGLGGTSQEQDKEDMEFLHKYMTLTRCDLLFADKAVLIEGMTERLLLPQMIAKIDAERADGPKLSSQYVSVVEVGGAYAHRFFKLLNFLELRTLIITDLDATKENDKNKLVACKVSKGSRTSNGCIKDWFGGSDITPADLIKKSDDEKTRGILRLAYEVPETEDAACGRSFEDAFILANKGLFGLTGGNAQESEEEAWNMAQDVKKSDFAMEYAIHKSEWAVPLYIAEGLRWLAEGLCGPTTIQSQAYPAPTEG